MLCKKQLGPSFSANVSRKAEYLTSEIEDEGNDAPYEKAVESEGSAKKTVIIEIGDDGVAEDEGNDAPYEMAVVESEGPAKKTLVIEIDDDGVAEDEGNDAAYETAV